MINKGDKVIQRTATGYTRQGKVVYVHPRNWYYTAAFPCPNGQQYRESFPIWKPTMTDEEYRKVRSAEYNRQKKLRREFRYGV